MSTGAAVIRTVSDQALCQPEQTDETDTEISLDKIQAAVRTLKKYLVSYRVILERLALSAFR